MKFYQQNLAFTLIELMVVVVIIGLLASVALPSYKQYVLRAKLAEAYSNLGALQKNEISYYYNYGEFKGIGSQNPAINSPTMVIENQSTWDGFYPSPIGSRVFFSYYGLMGKIDSSGTELTNSTVTGGAAFTSISFVTNYLRRNVNASGTRCNSGTFAATSFGAVSQANYDWLVMTAVSDINNDEGTTCTSVIKLIEAKSRIPDSPYSFMILNFGQ